MSSFLLADDAEGDSMGSLGTLFSWSWYSMSMSSSSPSNVSAIISLGGYLLLLCTGVVGVDFLIFSVGVMESRIARTFSLIVWSGERVAEGLEGVAEREMLMGVAEGD